MTATGVRYSRGKVKYVWISNTGHGNHVTGPKGPFEMSDAYAAQGSWMPVSRIEPILRSGDSHSVSMYEGFTARTLPDIGSHIFG